MTRHVSIDSRIGEDGPLTPPDDADLTAEELGKLARELAEKGGAMVADPSTGALKADAQKNMLGLLPIRAIEQVGLVLTYGSHKYDANNWRKGMSWTRLTSATLRHLFAWMRGEDIDPESQLSHLSHCATNILFILEMTLTSTGDDDRYKYAPSMN